MDHQARTEPLILDVQFHEALDAMFDNVAIGVAIRDDDGRIVDFRMVYLNSSTLDGAGRSGPDLLGRTVTETFPAWAESGLLARFSQVVETGEPFIGDRIRYEDTAPDGSPIHGYWSLSVAKFGDGYITASRDVTDLVADEVAQRAAREDADRNRLAVELLQRAALPARLPELDGLQIEARYEAAAAAQAVGGDWYDAFELGDGRLGLVIADVAGHGLDAAAFMVQVRNIVRAIAFEHGEPGVVMQRSNEVVAQLEEQNLFATCCYGVVDLAEGTFTWASAGHPPPLLVTSEPRYLVGPVGPPLGVDAVAPFASAAVAFGHGESLVLFTDGLVEERAMPLTESLEALRAASVEWVAHDAAALIDAATARSQQRADDLAVLCVRRSA